MMCGVVTEGRKSHKIVAKEVFLFTSANVTWILFMSVCRRCGLLSLQTLQKPVQFSKGEANICILSYKTSGFYGEVNQNVALLINVLHLVKLHWYYGTTCSSHHLCVRSMACTKGVGECVLKGWGVGGTEMHRYECATISWPENILWWRGISCEEIHRSVEEWYTFFGASVCFPQAAKERFPWSTPSPVHVRVLFQFNHCPNELVHIATLYPRSLILI